MFLKTCRILLVFLMFFGLSFVVQAADKKKPAGTPISRGKAKAATCVACHGPAGISNNPIWPNLAGQKKEYLIKQLKAFKAGTRKEPTMLPFIQNLSEADFKDLAAYFSSLKCK